MTQPNPILPATDADAAARRQAAAQRHVAEQAVEAPDDVASPAAPLAGAQGGTPVDLEGASVRGQGDARRYADEAGTHVDA